MPQDKASQFVAVGMIYSPSPTQTIAQQDVYACKRCGVLVLGDDREHHLVWHLMIRANFTEIADWLNPGEV